MSVCHVRDCMEWGCGAEGRKNGASLTALELLVCIEPSYSSNKQLISPLLYFLMFGPQTSQRKNSWWRIIFHSILWVLYAVLRPPPFFSFGGLFYYSPSSLRYFLYQACKTGAVIVMFICTSVKITRNFYFW